MIVVFLLLEWYVPEEFYYKVLIGTEHREHLFAVVEWFKEHCCRMLYGKPLEVWNCAQYVDDDLSTNP